MRWNDLIGRQLDQYTILEEIGRGGSSRVYRGHDAETERDVAIKIIPNDAEDRVGFVHRFEREVQAVAQLNHPNIVTVFDRGETDDLVYLIMQCVMGGTLRSRLGKPLPTHEATDYIVQMAQALHHAHQKGIVHRDVKPSNMLIDAENPRHLLLTDFGIAKLQGARGLTKTGTTIGTPEYMAPEQAEGKETDARADVYSLGCVLYEALAGRPPFIGSSPVSVLYQQVHSRPAYIRGFNPDVPRELTRILETTLAKRPDDRYGTAELLAQALAPFTEERAPGTPAASAFGPPAPEPPRSAPVPGLDWPPAPHAHGASIPSLSATAGPVSPVPGEWRGLGAEGLDALFPEDSQSQRSGASPLGAAGAGRGASIAAGTEAGAEAGANGAANIPAVEEGRTHHTIPLPAFRLPARRTRPLDLPLTPSGELDMERLMAQVDSPMLGGARPRNSQAELGRPRMDPWNAEPEANAPIGPQGQPSLREALLHTGEYRAVRPVWRPAPEELASGVRPIVRKPRRPRRPRRRLGRPLWVGIGVAAVLLLAAAAWVGVSTSALGLTLPGTHSLARATATATTAPTATPTATATPAATATATTNPQAALDQQAAGAFRAVTLSPFADGSCSSGNNTTHFANGQSVYVNLCIANNAPSAPMTIQIRQKGTVFVALVQNFPIGPSGGNFYFFRNGLGPGTYDVQITLQLNGHSATARDITFTVG